MGMGKGCDFFKWVEQLPSSKEDQNGNNNNNNSYLFFCFLGYFGDT